MPMDTRFSHVHMRDAEFESCPDGSLLVRNPEPLRSYPKRMTERLECWAARSPDRPFLAARSARRVILGGYEKKRTERSSSAGKERTPCAG
jgi:hypothetical protein